MGLVLCCGFDEGTSVCSHPSSYPFSCCLLHTICRLVCGLCSLPSFSSPFPSRFPFPRYAGVSSVFILPSLLLPLHSLCPRRNTSLPPFLPRGVLAESSRSFTFTPSSFSSHSRFSFQCLHEGRHFCVACASHVGSSSSRHRRAQRPRRLRAAPRLPQHLHRHRPCSPRSSLDCGCCSAAANQLERTGLAGQRRLQTA